MLIVMSLKVEEEDGVTAMRARGSSERRIRLSTVQRAVEGEVLVEDDAQLVGSPKGGNE